MVYRDLLEHADIINYAEAYYAAQAATASARAEAAAAEAAAAVCRSMQEQRWAEATAMHAHEEHEFACRQQLKELAVVEAGVLREVETKSNIPPIMGAQADDLDRLFVMFLEVGVSPPRCLCFLDAKKTWTIGTLKAKIQDKKGIKTKLFCKTSSAVYCPLHQELKDDDRTLRSYGICDSDTVVAFPVPDSLG
jgi:hypothetical protein